MDFVWFKRRHQTFYVQKQHKMCEDDDDLIGVIAENSSSLVAFTITRELQEKLFCKLKIKIEGLIHKYCSCLDCDVGPLSGMFSLVFFVYFLHF